MKVTLSLLQSIFWMLLARSVQAQVSRKYVAWMVTPQRPAAIFSFGYQRSRHLSAHNPSSQPPHTNSVSKRRHDPNQKHQKKNPPHPPTKIAKTEEHRAKPEHDHKQNNQAALHQAEHRAVEKSSLALGQRIAEQLAATTKNILTSSGLQVGRKAAERMGGERLVERTGERLVERAGDRIAERAGERVAERLTERAAERSGERIGISGVGSMFERLGQIASGRVGEQTAEKTAQRIGDRAIERSVEHVAEKMGEKAVGRTGEKAAERIVERAIERTGERMLERASEQAVTKAGEQTIKMAGRGAAVGERSVGIIERLAERIGGQSAERAMEQGARQAGRIGDRAIERTGEKALGRAGIQVTGRGTVVAERSAGMFERMLGISSERVALRVGRGLLITFPALGGIFALYLLKSDIQRCQEEWSKRAKWSTACFVSAGLADLFDSFLHFFITYALVVQLGHHALVLPEELSMGCAIVSTVSAVFGEMLSLKKTKQNEDSTSVKSEL